MRTELSLDSTKITSYLTCPTMFNYEHEVGIVKSGRNRTALDRGTVMHGLLERYYAAIWSGKSQQDSIGAALTALIELKTQVSLEDKDFALLTRRFIEYCANYASDKLTVQSLTESKPAIEVGFSVPILDNDLFYFVLEGRIDLLGTINNPVFIDHKTQERKKDLYQYSIQFMNYALVTGLRHGMINYIGLTEAVNKDTFRRQLIYFGAEKLRQWKEQLIQIFKEVANPIDRFGSGVRPKNFAMCGGMYGYPCQYSTLCEQTDPQITKSLIQMQFEKREIWKPWRLEEE